MTCPPRSSPPAVRSRCDDGRDGHGREAEHAGADHCQAAASRGAAGARQSGGRGGPGDRGDGADVLPLAFRVWRAEARPGEAAEAAGGGERAAAQGGGGPDAREGHPEGSRLGKLLSAARRRACVEHVTTKLGISERLACKVLGQHRSTQRKAPSAPDDEAALRDEIIALAKLYGRYGYRRVTALPRVAGWCTNHKRVERIWQQEGLKVPPRQPKRGRLWLNDGSCVRLRPERPNHVWAYDFVEDRTRDGRRFRMLNVVDEFTRECSPSGSRASSARPMSSTCWPTCSSPAARPRMSAPTTGRDSSSKPRGAGPAASARRRRSSSPGVRGKTATWRASTASCATSSWERRCSTRSPKPRC